MVWPTWGTVALCIWALVNGWVAGHRLSDPWVYHHEFWTTVVGHTVYVGVPVLWWWMRDPRRRARRRALRALEVVRNEGLLLGPAFDDLVVEAEHLWDSQGQAALSEYDTASRELRRGVYRWMGNGRGIEALQSSRDAALANAGRSVLALELLGTHLLKARIRKTDRPVVAAEIERLQRCANGAFSAHEEADDTLSLTE